MHIGLHLEGVLLDLTYLCQLTATNDCQTKVEDKHMYYEGGGNEDLIKTGPCLHLLTSMNASCEMHMGLGPQT